MVLIKLQCVLHNTDTYTHQNRKNVNLVVLENHGNLEKRIVFWSEHHSLYLQERCTTFSHQSFGTNKITTSSLKYTHLHIWNEKWSLSGPKKSLCFKKKLLYFVNHHNLHQRHLKFSLLRFGTNKSTICHEKYIHTYTSEMKKW